MDFILASTAAGLPACELGKRVTRKIVAGDVATRGVMWSLWPAVCLTINGGYQYYVLLLLSHLVLISFKLVEIITLLQDRNRESFYMFNILVNSYV